MIYWIMRKFVRYQPEYDTENNVLIIHKPIPVKEFAKLRWYLEFSNVKLYDIRVGR